MVTGSSTRGIVVELVIGDRPFLAARQGSATDEDEELSPIQPWAADDERVAVGALYTLDQAAAWPSARGVHDHGDALARFQHLRRPATRLRPHERRSLSVPSLGFIPRTNAHYHP